MKNLKIVLAGLLLSVFTFGSAFANGIDSNPKADELKIEMTDLLKDLDFTNLEASTETVYVNFLINNKKEIVVLSTSEEGLDETIKARLNYKTVKTENISMFKKYTLPVVIK